MGIRTRQPDMRGVCPSLSLRDKGGDGAVLGDAGYRAGATELSEKSSHPIDRKMVECD